MVMTVGMGILVVALGASFLFKAIVPISFLSLTFFMRRIWRVEE